ncbi:MAG: pyrroline-5-carboxylate reductase [Pseudomonadota bacterium]
MSQDIKLIQIGAGAMGGALLKSWVSAGLLDAGGSAIVDPMPSEDIQALCEKAGLSINPEDSGGYDVCLLAVKPQMFSDVLPTLDWHGIEDTLFVSIAAGVTSSEIAMLLKEHAPKAKVLRVMPSLPAQVGRGVTLLSEDPNLSPADRDLGERLMQAASGAVHWCRSEDELDRLMGVTGCAPAFLLNAVEGLILAAEDQGASPDVARRLAEETFYGTAALLEADDRPPSDLRAAVTSKGGTTAAGLEVLAEAGFSESLKAAVEGAYQRAKALASGPS